VLHGSEIPELIDRVDPKKLWVHSPSSILFVCGGKYDLSEQQPLSLRDAFLRFCHDRPLDAFEKLIAEDLNAFFPRGTYSDILKFEADLAQICDIVIVFSESYGSAAELGAFSMEQEIASRLLVVIDDKNFDDISFITLGPLKALMRDYGNPAVCVVSRQELKIASIAVLAGLDQAALKRIIVAAIEARKLSYHEKSTFDPSRDGHIIKMAVGLLQHYAALTIKELALHLELFGVEKSIADIENYLLCAEFAGWIKKTRRGVETYYVSLVDKLALTFEFKSGKFMERLRWRGDIIVHWNETDESRSTAIREARSR